MVNIVYYATSYRRSPAVETLHVIDVDRGADVCQRDPLAATDLSVIQAAERELHRAPRLGLESKEVSVLYWHRDAPFAFPRHQDSRAVGDAVIDEGALVVTTPKDVDDIVLFNGGFDQRIVFSGRLSSHRERDDPILDRDGVVVNQQIIPERLRTGSHKHGRRHVLWCVRQSLSKE